jgi:hypothetical protein
MALTTTSEILTRIKQELRDELSVTATSARLLARLNEAYVDILEGGGHLNDSIRGIQSPKPFVFSFALSPNNIVFNTEAPIKNLTSTIANGSNTLTLSATYPTSLVGYFVKVGTDKEKYKITAHTAGTDTLTLDGNYVEESASAEGTVIFKLDYEIGTDILMPTNGLINYKYNEVLPLIDKREFEKYGKMIDIREGYPSYAVIQENNPSSKSITVRFGSYTKEAERFELPYVPYPTALDEVSSDPIFRPSDNQLLVDYVVAMEYDLRDDSIAEKYMKRAMDRFRIMKSIDRQFTAYQDKLFAKVIGWSRGPDTLSKSFYASLGHPRNTFGRD